MFPGIYDFKWDAGHIVFLGIFYSVLAVVLTTMTIAFARAIRSFRERRVEALRWHADFDDLPASARRCRHELTGELASRECPNGFDCRRCTKHAEFAEVAMLLDEPVAAGFAVPADRLYHRGHTWVQPDGDGTMTVGLDDLASHLLRDAWDVRMPAIGSHLVANGTGWETRHRGVDLRILSPLDGEVVGTNDGTDGWFMKIRPFSDDMRHLLTPAEAKAWMLREVERLQLAMASDVVGGALADGGTPVDDLSSVIPREKLDEVYGMMFLHP